MPKVSVYIATSLDGFIARRDGDIDFLDQAGKPLKDEDYGYKAFIESIDVLVMGRNTFEKVLTFGAWPYTKPVIVMSRTLNALPEELKDKVSLFSGTPQELINDLRTKGNNHIYLDGGQLIQAFLRENFINELIMTRLPILIGEGLPLFSEIKEDIKLEHLKTQSFASGFVQSHYRVEI